MEHFFSIVQFVDEVHMVHPFTFTSLKKIKKEIRFNWHLAFMSNLFSTASSVDFFQLPQGFSTYKHNISENPYMLKRLFRKLECMRMWSLMILKLEFYAYG
jgi:phosphatidylserine synthase